MIYFDNAATGGFKPHSVIEAVTAVTTHLLANPTRSGHKLSAVGGELIFKTRKLLREFFGGESVERVVFTKNCTEALSTAIFGLLKEGDHVVTTCMEHNSVLRPLSYLKEAKKVDFSVVVPQKAPFISQKPLITYLDVKKHIRPETRLVITNQVSNVTGAFTDVDGIGQGLKHDFKDVVYLVDGAQSAGHLPIDMQKSGIDVLCLAGHKGLCGIMGSGVLIFGNVDIAPLTRGGTGTDSFNLFQPEYYPERLESGTLALPAIVSLYEGVLHVKNNLTFIGGQLTKMTEYLVNALNNIPEIKVYSAPNPSGIVAFNIQGCPSVQAGEILNGEFDIAVRSGFHCAPLMHEFLGTSEDGLVRASLSVANTYKEMDALVSAVKKICKTGV